MVLQFFTEAFSWLGKAFVSIFEALWDIGKDGACWVLEQGLQIAGGAVNAVDVSAFSSAGQWWTNLPAEILNMLGLVGFGQCMAIIGAAIVIRLGLQLIPFVRLGS